MPVDIEAHLADVSLALERLKVLYEQYFIGIEKQPPNVARREVEKVLAFLAVQNIGNTAVRFRYQTLLRRWKTYAERWDKVLREIDQGVYARHVSRAKRRGLIPDDPRVPPAPAPAAPLTALASEMTSEEDAVLNALSALDGPSPAPSPAPPLPVAKPRVAPPTIAANGIATHGAASPIPGMTEGDLRALHQRYVEALRQNGDRREVKFESLVSSLRKQLPELLKKNQCDGVAFNVTIRDGKVLMRATPRKG